MSCASFCEITVLMEETKLAHETNTQQEAMALQERLEREGIAAALVDHRDTACTGIVDRARSGTEVRVPADQLDRAKELIREYLAARPIEGPPDAPPPDSAPAAAIRGPGWLIMTLVLFLFLGVAIYLISP